MNREAELCTDERAAATELGYIFTFLLGVMLMTMFSVWAWDIETNTRLRWNQEAIQANMDDLAAAVERADEASRLGNVSYAEEVAWRPTEADESLFWVELTDTAVVLIDDGGPLDTEVPISGAGRGVHEGMIPLAGVDRIWVIYDDGVTSISLERSTNVA